MNIEEITLAASAIKADVAFQGESLSVIAGQLDVDLGEVQGIRQHLEEIVELYGRVGDTARVGRVREAAERGESLSVMLETVSRSLEECVQQINVISENLGYFAEMTGALAADSQ